MPICENEEKTCGRKRQPSHLPWNLTEGPGRWFSLGTDSLGSMATCVLKPPAKSRTLVTCGLKKAKSTTKPTNNSNTSGFGWEPPRKLSPNETKATNVLNGRLFSGYRQHWTVRFSVPTPWQLVSPGIRDSEVSKQSNHPNRTSSSLQWRSPTEPYCLE